MPYNLTTMQSIFCNNKEITEIRCNGSLVYQKQSGPDYSEPFYVENITNANENLIISKAISSAPTLTIEYSTDKTNWETFGTTSTTPMYKTLAPGEKVYLRCNTNTWSENVNYNKIIGISKVGGNIMSLLYGNNFTGQETDFPSVSTNILYCLFFSNNNLVDASELLLPATTLTNGCYFRMFRNCSYLTAGPVLPATTLQTNCYNGMFMGCSRLISAPVLPATTLVNGCYGSMFQDCGSLTKAPDLPATTLVNGCYTNMFLRCNLLNEIKCLATSGINENDSTANWLSGVSSTGTFTKAAGVEWPSGVNGIPEGWTVDEV